VGPLPGVEGAALLQAAALAAGQRLPARLAQAAPTLLLRLLPLHLPHPHRDRQHLDALAGQHHVRGAGVLRGAVARHVYGEGTGVPGVPGGRRGVPRPLHHVPHPLLPLRVRGQALLQVRLLRHSGADHGLVRAVAVLRLLLRPQAQADLHGGGAAARRQHHRGVAVGQVLHAALPPPPHLRVPGVRAVGHRAGSALQPGRGRGEGVLQSSPRAPGPHGQPVRHRRRALCPQGARALVPRQVRPGVPLAPDLPHAGGASGVRALPRHLLHGHVPRGPWRVH